MDSFYYFGYASNLDTSTLEGRLQTRPVKIGIGVLRHHGFRFNHPNQDGSARANIVPSENESVYGLIFKIRNHDMEYFLTSEPGYDLEEKEVFTKDGKVNAFVFISKNTQEGIFPKEEYWKLILKGGKESGIPDSYLAQVINRVGKI
ncbi:gamma-glutamylcyclotransferase [Aquiflexum sp. LQ15W]|uniref:gamma-glutamylcyclotransferase family protein n=1 Tax=Cognataquiflexum nitidum TaxID=2922272 RepID=UPI001F13CE61|nr:gamma-glutamylcyclotransferase family protein [Cognataquiflexum nitidum]MCH6199046.1 gamma-glutamylcyclotransferase [Cognataquiflexum nitidum]